MKIVDRTDDYVRLEGGVKSVNEIIWNYRSDCCFSPIDLVAGKLICGACLEEVTDVMHKSAGGGVQIAEVINALPGDARDSAAMGYYNSLRGAGIDVVHIFDKGGEDDRFSLLQEMRK